MIARTPFLLLLALVSACASLSTANIRVDEHEVAYHVDLSQPHTQTVVITVTVPTAGVEEEELMLPTWRPGRYVILNPAGTVREVRAVSGDGRELDIRKTAKSTWSVRTEGADEIEVSYRVYANSLGDRTRHVDPTHAFLSGSSVFFYSPRLRSAPVRVEVSAPPEWDIATGMEFAAGESRVVVADNYDVLVDSPLEIGEHDRIDWEVDGRKHEIVIWPKGVEHDAERLIEDFTKIIRAQAAIFGRMPYDRYVFLVHARQGGGGTEHLNSTIMQTSRGALEGSVDNSSSYKRFLGLVSHEFFHTWNVKQLRPAGIHPYDYQKENYTDLLWVSEGTTSYYTSVTLVRAGLSPVKKYIDGLGSAGNSLRNNPGARIQSLAESSWDSWVSSFNANSGNVSVDFYGKGSQVSLCLDLEIRRRTENQASLDSVLRTMFENFPLDGPGFTSGDMLATLQAATGTSFEEFFARYVSGTELLPFEDVLPTVGLEFYFDANKDKDEKENEDEQAGEAVAVESAADTDGIVAPPMKAYLGLRLSGGGSGSTVRSLRSDGPAYTSGLIAGDEILTMNEERLRSGDLDERLEELEPGDTVRFHFLRDDKLHILDIELAGVPDGSWKVRRVEEPTDLQKATYRSWLGQPWPGDEEQEDDEKEDEGSDA